MFKQFIDKLFRDKDGHIAVLQIPNLPLITWGIATLGAHFLPQGGWRKGSGYVAVGALIVWTVLEIYNGSSLFRRLIGAGILFAIAYNRL